MKKQNKPEEIKKDIEYLDQEFPKGETKFRGQAMVLLTLAREQGKAEARKEFLEMIEIYFNRKLKFNKDFLKKATENFIGSKKEINIHYNLTNELIQVFQEELKMKIKELELKE